jgi:hypothetical protein
MDSFILPGPGKKGLLLNLRLPRSAADTDAGKDIALLRVVRGGSDDGDASTAWTPGFVKLSSCITGNAADGLEAATDDGDDTADEGSLPCMSSLCGCVTADRTATP